MDKNFHTIVLLGETEVGKTALLRTIMDDIFTPIQNATLRPYTESKVLTINNKTISLKFWDTPGIQRFQKMNNFLIKKSEIVILVYNVTNRQSFDEIMYYYY